MNNINYARMSPEAKEDIMRRARVHLEFVCRLHRRQHRAGRFFVHEHPAWATSWRERCVQEVIRETGAKLTRIDQCMYGLMSKDTQGEWHPAKKPTILMSNMDTIENYVSNTRDGSHKHTPFEGGG